MRVRGEPEEAIAAATINVKIYNMAAVYSGLPESTDPVFRENNIETIDVRMFRLSEQKDRSIHHVLRFAKRASYDCYLNYDRNVRPSDINGSSICDYQDCAYNCSGINPDIVDKPDRTTKILYYSQKEVASAIDAIKNLFSRFSALKIDQIYHLLPNIDQIFIDMALEEMIRLNIKITDRLGYFGYLRESKNSGIYLESDPFTVKALPENTAYTAVLIGTQDPRNNTFADYVTNMESIKQAPLLQELIQLGNQPEMISGQRFTEILEALALSNKVALLEYVLLQRRTTGETTDFANAIISAYSHSIFELREPIAKLQDVAFSIANEGKGPGRKRGSGAKTKAKTKPIEASQIPTFNPNNPGEQVIIHTFLNQAFTRTNYNVVKSVLNVQGKLRIFKLSEGTGWRDVNEYEQRVYNDLIQRQIKEIWNYYERYSIYGVILPPMNQFRIRDREIENQTDARSMRSGKVCGTWNKPDLVNLLYRLGITLFNQPPVTLTRQEIISYLASQDVTRSISEFTDDKLIFFYNWYRTNYGKDDMCTIIRQYLEREGRIFTGRMPRSLANRPPAPVMSSGSIQTLPPEEEGEEGIELGEEIGEYEYEDPDDE